MEGLPSTNSHAYWLSDVRMMDTTITLKLDSNDHSFNIGFCNDHLLMCTRQITTLNSLDTRAKSRECPRAICAITILRAPHPERLCSLFLRL